MRLFTKFSSGYVWHYQRPAISKEITAVMWKGHGFWSFFLKSNLEVSWIWNGGIPKSFILMGFSIVNQPFWDTPIYGNPHILHFEESWVLEVTQFMFAGARSQCTMMRPPTQAGADHQLSFSGIFAAHCMTQRISCKWHHPGIIFCEEILFEIRLWGHWTQSRYAIHICFLSQMLRRFYSKITEMCCDFDFNSLEQQYRLKAEGFDLLRIKLVYLKRGYT